MCIRSGRRHFAHLRISFLSAIGLLRRDMPHPRSAHKRASVIILRLLIQKMSFFRRVFFTGNGNVPLLDMYCIGHPSRIIQPLFDFPPFPPTIGAKFGKRKMSSFFGLFSFLLPTWRLSFFFGGGWGRGIMKTLKGGMYFWVGAHKTSFTLSSSIYFTSWRRWEKAACVV